MIGVGFFRLEFAFLWTMNRPNLVSRSPVVSLAIDFLGVCLPVPCILLIPLFFSLPILILIVSMFLNLALDFSFSLAFTFASRRGLEILGKFEVVVFHFLNNRCKCNNLFLFWGD